MFRLPKPAIALLLAAVLAAVCAPSPAAEPPEVTRYVRFKAGETIAYGVLEGDRVRQLEGSPLRRWKPTETTYALSDVKLLVPTRPTKVLAAAVNYKSHAEAQDAAAPPPDQRPQKGEPQFFFKVPSCLVAQGQPIVIPKGTEAVDHEAELVIVVGRRAKNVPVERALDYVLGVTCGNDVSARDWQKADVQWWRAKGSDTFGPCGPCIVSGIDYNNLLLTCRVNGEVRQQQNTRDMIHGVAELVGFASRFVTLEPGDLIFTGTPGKTTRIKPGDVVEVELEGVGVLSNPVKAAR